MLTEVEETVGLLTEWGFADDSVDKDDNDPNIVTGNNTSAPSHSSLTKARSSKCLVSGQVCDNINSNTGSSSNSQATTTRFPAL